MSAMPHGPIDPEEAIQERGDWVVDCFLAVLTYAPVLPLVIYCAAMAVTAVAIVVSYFAR